MNISINNQVLFVDYLSNPYMDDYVTNAKHGPIYLLLFDIDEITQTSPRKSFIYRRSTLSINQLISKSHWAWSDKEQFFNELKNS